jgi:DNA-binding HxlR family transcriptional regulator
VSGYGQFCPVAQAAEVLAERWTPLVLREIVLGGATRFNDIQRGVPLMSSTLLSKRLRALERAGVIERSERGRSVEYSPTAAGRELAPLIEQMGVWSERWLRRPISTEDADPRFLMWTVRGFVDTDAVPTGRSVAHFRFPKAADKLRYWWLVLDPPQVDLCLTDPGFETDLTVTTEPRVLASVIAGDLELPAAIRKGEVVLAGSTDATRAFPRWFGVSPFAGVERADRAPA